MSTHQLIWLKMLSWVGLSWVMITMAPPIWQIISVLVFYQTHPRLRLAGHRLITTGCGVIWQPVISPSCLATVSECFFLWHWRALWWSSIGPDLWFPHPSVALRWHWLQSPFSRPWACQLAWLGRQLWHIWLIHPGGTPPPTTMCSDAFC